MVSVENLRSKHSARKKYIYFIVLLYLHISILFTNVQYDTFRNLRRLPGALCLQGL